MEDMEDLRLVGVHDDGTHLLLEGAPGTHYRVRLNETLRAAARQDRVRLGQLQIEVDTGMRPRDIQAMVRAGATSDEVAARSGWSIEKVERFEGPIRAERAHVAELARSVRIRTRASGAGREPSTLEGRVHSRMRARDVDPISSQWDAWRDPGDAQWTVAVSFEAGDRTRRAHWWFDLGTRGLAARDDEARWLSEDESAPADGPVPSTTTGRPTIVYDVEAEGGVTADRAARQLTPDLAAAGHRPAAQAPPLDLMTAMRQRSAARGRGGRRGTGASRGPQKGSPTYVPRDGEMPEDALPVTEIDYDVERHGLPPAAHPRPSRPGSGARGPRRDRTASGDVPTMSVGDLFTPDVDAEDDPDLTGAQQAERTEELALRDAADSASTVPSHDGVPSPLGVVTAPRDHDDHAHGSDAGGEPSELQTAGDSHRRTAAPARRGRATVPSWDDVMFGGPRD